MAREISSRDGSGFFSSSASAFMTRPGEQNPHCDAPDAQKHRAHRSRSSGVRPSRVVTSFSAARVAGWAQETTAFPSTITVHAPQEPSGAHPSFIDVRPSCSRSTSRRVAPSRASTETGRPFSLKARAVTSSVRIWLVMISPKKVNHNRR